MTGKRSEDPLDELSINTIRTLAMDAVQEANSGHPGTAMAPVAYCLWQKYLRFDPEDPIWPNRDRFVLSIGHTSMLLYALLHLSGVRAVNPKYERLGSLSVPLGNIRRFRQLGSRCPGHPEYEGVSSEAASLAGHLKLSNLCWIYDNNHITIEGHTDWAFSDDVATRFVAYGWNVTRVVDANDLDMLSRAFDTFRQTSDRPTLIIVDSHIAYGSPNKQDTASAHGSPLGEEEIRLTKRRYGWPEDERFLVPDGVRDHFQHGVGRRGREARDAWMARFESYETAHPELARRLYQMQHRDLPEDWDEDLPEFPPDGKGVSGRDASARVLNAIAQKLPWLVGGSADLAPSTKTRLTFDGAGEFRASSYGGRNFHFGVREHATGSILNGLSLIKIRPYGSGFPLQ